MRPQLTHLSLLFFIFYLNLSAQEGYTVSGTVTDARTGETLPFANVFFAETTYGVNTDESGNYELIVPNSGTYDFIVRFIGYETYGVNLRLNEEKEIKLDVALVPEEMNIGSFTLTARKDENWPQYLKLFKQNFLGFSENASKCEILNEEDLNFYYDKEENAFYGFSKKPIRVENEALGYIIDYYLEEFKIDYSRNINSYYGFTVFTEMKSNSKRKNLTWERNRKKAYEGSMQHFFSSVFQNKVEEEGYLVQVAKDMEGWGRVMDPSNIDVKDYISAGESNLSKTLPFDHYLYITYTREKETPEYVKNFKPGGRMNSVSLSSLGKQVSWISLAEGKKAIEFERTGYVYDPLSFFSAGYWGYEKVADMVPINYRPKQ